MTDKVKNTSKKSDSRPQTFNKKMIQVCKMFTATDCRINIQPKRDIDFLKGFIFKVGFLIVLLNLTELKLFSVITLQKVMSTFLVTERVWL